MRALDGAAGAARARSPIRVGVRATWLTGDVLAIDRGGFADWRPRARVMLPTRRRALGRDDAGKEIRNCLAMGATARPTWSTRRTSRAAGRGPRSTRRSRTASNLR